MTSTTPTSIPTVDLSPFTNTTDQDSDSARLQAAKALVNACHSLGFVKIKGHGFSDDELASAFAFVKKLFDLPLEDKMKAPHPAGHFPHRGYSGVGMEKVYHHHGTEDTKESTSNSTSDDPIPHLKV